MQQHSAQSGRAEGGLRLASVCHPLCAALFSGTAEREQRVMRVEDEPAAAAAAETLMK